ncbi:MAG: hypothetical protein OXC61_08410 [Flavobacteriaceae bacterium]|nr:hypothetical protein [Flavobacteriaceae bacterium]
MNALLSFLTGFVFITSQVGSNDSIGFKSSQKNNIGSRNLELLSHKFLPGSTFHKDTLILGGMVVFVEPVIEQTMTLNYIDIKIKKKIKGENNISLQLFSPKTGFQEKWTFLDLDHFKPLLKNPIKQVAESGWNRISLKDWNIQFPKHGFYAFISSSIDESMITNQENTFSIFDFYLYDGNVTGLTPGFVKSFPETINQIELMYSSSAVDSTIAIVVSTI